MPHAWEGASLFCGMERNFVQHGMRHLLPALFSLGALLAGAQVPYMVRNINAAFQESSDPLFLTPFNDGVAFRAYTGAQGSELWYSDGTQAGTILLKDMLPGAGSADPRDLVVVDDLLFCTAQVGRQLWVSDGTPAGTDTVRTFPNIGAIKEEGLIALNGLLLFAVNSPGVEDELWATDGTYAGTTLLHTFTPGNSEGIDAFTFHVYDNALYFMGSDGPAGREVWRSDGTVGGTFLLKDIHTEAQNSSDLWDPNFITFNDTLFFTANSVGYDYELWKSDGTTAGTQRVKDITPGVGGSGIRDLTIVGTKLFFPAVVSGSSELWATDGSEAGTYKVADVGDPHELTALGNWLVYVDDVVALNMGTEPWRSDGTPGGTTMITEINAGPDDGVLWNGTFFQEVDGVLYFRGNDGVSGEELWRTDGTDLGTAQVKDLYPGPNDGFINNATWSLPVGNALLFDAVNAQLGNTIPELWISDGTAVGTYRLTINTFGDGSLPGRPVRSGDLLFFAANNGTHGRELWALDATPLSTAVPEQVPAAAVTVHPVPATDRLFVQWATGAGSAGRLRLLDLQGREVLHAPWNGDRAVLDIEALPQGLYVLQVREHTGRRATATFSKQ